MVGIAGVGLLSVALAEGHAKGCAQTAMRMAMGKHSHARFRQFFKSPSGLRKKKRSALSNERNRALFHGEQRAIRRAS